MRQLIILALISIAFPAIAADDADEALVKTAGLSTDGAALLNFVKQRSRATADTEELTAFIKDAEGRLLYINPAFEQAFDFSFFDTKR